MLSFRYDGPFTGRRELAGCGGGQPGIAKQAALQQGQLAGQWIPEHSTEQPQVLLLGGGNISCGVTSCVDACGGGVEGVIETLLPLGAWSAVAITAAGQLQHAEAGVVLQNAGEECRNSSRMVSVRKYSEQGDGTACMLVQAGVELQSKQ